MSERRLADLAPVARLSGARVLRGGETLIDGLTLSVPARGVLALMGPNGAGKSLTLRLLAGLVRPQAGQADWDGAPLPPRPKVALVFQRPVMLRRSVRGTLTHALATYGVPRRERAARCDALLRLGRLEALAERPARWLSGGEQQRLALVRALGAEPRLLLLDEPTASLDPEATAAIETLIRQAAEAGTSVVLVTHDPGQARRLADRVAFLHRGRITAEQAAEDFFAAPASAEARAYLDGRLLL
ncbi:ATP-binding cassette domain-containing protein [Paroceanicella profunda]|uniref:ATP-binding cassette domain-containing protein n=1 Tax=Paroceanicella profunda TaxID=2579971 RepID=A0A5B8FRZ3_9RHOB|nr:ATP-binding cassette domain-containing protein [Paroceanicella profunda]QDL91115.1 ATP-binding cassette domain-containing protein [Paroceanicella profunda]